MGNTIENKEKFFAQYWGQEVHRVKMSHSFPLCKIGPHLYNNKIDNDYLELTPLSQISDEDAIEIGVIFCDITGESKSIFRLIDVKEMLFGKDRMPDIFSKMSDYLRSKGYALPYMGLSVEQQIEYGWVKLKQIENE